MHNEALSSLTKELISFMRLYTYFQACDEKAQNFLKSLMEKIDKEVKKIIKNGEVIEISQKADLQVCAKALLSFFNSNNPISFYWGIL